MLPLLTTGALAAYLWVLFFDYAEACIVGDSFTATLTGGLFMAGLGAAAGACAIYAVSSVLVAFGAARLRPRTSMVLPAVLAAVSLVYFSVLTAQPIDRSDSFSNSCDIYD